MDRVDCVVIGAGVVGLAAARALARAGHEVIIVEALDAGADAIKLFPALVHAPALPVTVYSVPLELEVDG